MKLDQSPRLLSLSLSKCKRLLARSTLSVLDPISATSFRTSSAVPRHSEWSEAPKDATAATTTQLDDFVLSFVPALLLL
ncbi:hypothetical protein KVV02_001487 [Mortierella alpina]|uniref:Uncharacterized protein n=1 Tax=Mortierella alpina TaxID=64518 RepID=A0A9P8D216_MORAP|nr:hypothetical protein KVV02_001487 [Mortierella alpina]